MLPLAVFSVLVAHWNHLESLWNPQCPGPTPDQLIDLLRGWHQVATVPKTSHVVLCVAKVETQWARGSDGSGLACDLAVVTAPWEMLMDKARTPWEP